MSLQFPPHWRLYYSHLWYQSFFFNFPQILMLNFCLVKRVRNNILSKQHPIRKHSHQLQWTIIVSSLIYKHLFISSTSSITVLFPYTTVHFSNTTKVVSTVTIFLLTSFQESHILSLLWSSSLTYNFSSLLEVLSFQIKPAKPMKTSCNTDIKLESSCLNYYPSFVLTSKVVLHIFIWKQTRTVVSLRSTRYRQWHKQPTQ